MNKLRSANVFVSTARYCGLPPPISNGFILSSSGVVYGSEVNYGCYSQYKLSSEASVKCLMNGTWSAPPSCVGRMQHLSNLT